MPCRRTTLQQVFQPLAKASLTGYVRYQSTVMGSFQTLELIETFISYTESIKRCVCIVYDPQRSSAGGHALKAVRLKESFIQARSQ